MRYVVLIGRPGGCTIAEDPFQVMNSRIKAGVDVFEIYLISLTKAFPIEIGLQLLKFDLEGLSAEATIGICLYRYNVGSRTTVGMTERSCTAS